MRFDIVTIFPDFFRGPFDYGVVPRAFRAGLAEAHTHDLRNFTHDRHRTVDDRPFGGGEGMVLKPGPVFDCVESLGVAAKGSRDLSHESVVLLSAQGRRFTQATARRLAQLDRVVLICGRYEGVDERVAQLLCDEELSIGDYVLSGGELAAAVVVDAVVRLLPGVLGHADSSRYESFGEGDEGAPEKTGDGVPRATHAANGLLDYPHYTRPADFRGSLVPEALANGDHAKVREWRRAAALAKTLANRPDLLRDAENPLPPVTSLRRILPVLLLCLLSCVHRSRAQTSAAPNTCRFSYEAEPVPHCTVARNGHIYIAPRYLGHLRTRSDGFGTNGRRYGLSAVLLDGKWAYADRSGRIVLTDVETMDNGPDDFHRGLVRVRVGGKQAFGNATGRLVIPAIYDGLFQFDQAEPGIAFACISCRAVTDGEHTSYDGGRWFRLSPSGKATPIRCSGQPSFPPCDETLPVR